MSEAAAPVVQALSERAEEVRILGAKDTVVESSPAVSIVDGERLSAPGMRLGDALRIVPGVSVRETGGFGAFASASLRGTTGAQTPVYFGAVLLNDDVAGTADLSAFSPNLFERVEVHRGHAPLDLDRQGLGGAIVLVPRKSRDGAARASLTAGTLGHRGVDASGGYANDGHEFFVAGVHDRASNRYPYLDDGGTVFNPSDDRSRLRTNADFSQWSGMFSGTSHLGPVRLRSLAFVTTREQGVPRLAVLPSVAARLAQDRELLALDGELPVSARSTLRLRSTATWAASAFHDALGELGLGTPLLTLNGQRYDERVAFDYKGDDLRFFSAIGAMAETLSRRGGAAIEASRSSVRAQFGLTYSLGAGFALEAAAVHEEQWQRAEGAYFDGLEARVHERVSTGRVVIKWASGDLEAMLVGARYARTPTLGERFGVDGAVRGNPALAPESGYSADGIARGTFGDNRALRYEAVVFARSMNNLVDYTKTSPGTVKPINIGTARILGGELALEFRAAQEVSMGAVTTLLDAQDTTETSPLVHRRLPFRARHVESIFVRYFPAFERGKTLRMEWRTSVEGERTMDPAGLARLPLQTFSDASVRGHSGAFQLGLRCANVFDAPRVDLVGYPLPGRTVDVSLAIETP